MKNIRIVVAGPRGRMGKETVEMITGVAQFELVAAVDYKYDGHQLSDIAGFSDLTIPVFSDCESCFNKVQADVLVDFTTPEIGKKNAALALKHKVRPVVGATGFTESDLKQLEKLVNEQKTGCFIAPNFALGSVLMMKFSQMAAKYFDDIEIIEMHHDRKLDAPSGTALKTAEMIGLERAAKQQGHPDEKEFLSGARGADVQGLHIHSIRLPGLLAHQQVMFGGKGESLTIRHDSFHRSSFMKGVKLSIETVMNMEQLVYGLENMIDLGEL